MVDLPVGETLGKSLPIFDAMTAEDAFAEIIVSIEADQRLNWIKQTSFQAHPLPGFDHVMESLNVPKAVQFAEIARTASFAANRPEITWGINRVHAPAAWDTTEGAGARVAVIDTGIDMTHPDLAGQVDGGYSSITKTENPEDYTDDNGHGTHVAGTIAAVRDGKGVVGVAPKARLYAVKVMDADGSGNMSDVIDGIVWAAKNGMQIANMSLGAPEGSDAMRSAVIYAKSKNVVLVAAAGNSYGDPVSFPAAYPEVIAVSASDAKDILAPLLKPRSAGPIHRPRNGCDFLQDGRGLRLFLRDFDGLPARGGPGRADHLPGLRRSLRSGRRARPTQEGGQALARPPARGAGLRHDRRRQACPLKSWPRPRKPLCESVNL